MGPGIFHDGVAVFDADSVVQPPHGFGTAPEVSEFSGAVQGGRIENDVVMDMGFVDVGADNKGVVSFCEAHRQLPAQAVGLFRSDFPWNEGLPYLIGQHIIRPTVPSGLGDVLPLCKKKFGVSGAAVTLVAGDKPATVRLFRIFYIVQDVIDCRPHRPALAGM